MAGAKKPNTVAVATTIVEPIIKELGLLLWDVRFEKEGSSWYLRYFIDKDGGVDINDCENVSRLVDKALDAADPIEQAYYLEVSSPGIERDLIKDWHFERYYGKKIQVRLIRAVENVRDFIGTLVSFGDNKVTMLLENDIEMVFEKSETSYIRVYDDFEFGGQEDE